MSPVDRWTNNTPLDDPGPTLTIQLTARELATLLDAILGHVGHLTETPWPPWLKPPIPWRPFYPTIDDTHFTEYEPLEVKEVKALYERLQAIRRGETPVKEGEVVD